jgi:PAS domain S-box-containing protein
VRVKLLQKPMRFSLRTRLTLLTEGLVVMIVLITGTITTIRERQTLETELRKRGIALATDLGKFTARPLLRNDLPTLRRFVNHTMEQDYVRYVAVLDPGGRVVMHSDLDEVGMTYRSDLSGVTGSSEGPRYADMQNAQNGERYYDITVPIRVEDLRLGTIRIGYSYMAVEEEIARARRHIIIIGIVTILGGALAAYCLAAYIAAPIRQITDATTHVAGGDLDTALEVRRGDEIGTLAGAFNRMTENLRRTTFSKDYVDSILGSMIDTLLVVGRDATINRLNNAACELLGYAENELLGSDVNLLLPPEENLFRGRGFRELFDKSTVVNHQTEFVAADGRRIPVLMSASVLRSKGGEILGAVVIARDITERRRAEEALRESARALRSLTSRIITAQEQERKRLSVELHDELGQALMVMKLKLRSVRDALCEDDEQPRGECDELISYVSDVAENVRRLSRDLSPSILEDLGLSAAIRWLVEAAAGSGRIDHDLEVSDVDDLFTREGKITLYRIAQECLTNILKHAGASRVSLVLRKQDGCVQMRVEDNGIGFDTEDITGRDAGDKGLGLATMHERARMLKGSLQIRSRKAGGTTITLTVPLHDRGIRL